jgi:hypothetical protein
MIGAPFRRPAARPSAPTSSGSARRKPDGLSMGNRPAGRRFVAARVAARGTVCRTWGCGTPRGTPECLEIVPSGRGGAGCGTCGFPPRRRTRFPAAVWTVRAAVAFERGGAGSTRGAGFVAPLVRLGCPLARTEGPAASTVSRAPCARAVTADRLLGAADTMVGCASAGTGGEASGTAAATGSGEGAGVADGVGAATGGAGAGAGDVTGAAGRAAAGLGTGAGSAGVAGPRGGSSVAGSR